MTYGTERSIPPFPDVITNICPIPTRNRNVPIAILDVRVPDIPLPAIPAVTTQIIKEPAKAGTARWVLTNSRILLFPSLFFAGVSLILSSTSHSQTCGQLLLQGLK
jgi:hypothetical protein